VKKPGYEGVAGWAAEIEKAASTVITQARAVVKVAGGASPQLEELAGHIDGVQRSLQRLVTLGAETAGYIEHVSELKTRAIMVVESAVRDRLTREGWRVDGEWPQLFLERGLELSYDGNALTFEVSSRRFTAFDIDGLVDFLRAEIKELVPKGFAPAKFIEQVAAAYDAAGVQGTVAISLIYRELVTLLQNKRFWLDAREANFVSFTRDQFRARLTACLEASAEQLRDKRRLRLFPPIDSKEALFLYQPSERRFGFVGRISFLSEDEGVNE
jgi:hypothetical protein